MNTDETVKPSSGQSEMPFAIVQGSPITQFPNDLYIPPEALEVFLEAFEGPLDLLLYLIKKQNLNILDIPIAEITTQYMRYIDLMEDLQLELAGEYLVMGAVLAEIKSRMLLPRIVEDEEEEDPRAELIRRLQEYERFKQSAEELDELPRWDREIFNTVIDFNERKSSQKPPNVSLDQLLHAFADVLARAEMYSHHMIHREALSVRERMTMILDRIRENENVEFKDLFTRDEGKSGVIVSFLAVLDLVKESLIDMVQNEINGPIYIKAAS